MLHNDGKQKEYDGGGQTNDALHLAVLALVLVGLERSFDWTQLSLEFRSQRKPCGRWKERPRREWCSARC